MNLSPWHYISVGFIGYFTLVLSFLIIPKKKCEIYVAIIMVCFGHIMIVVVD